MAEWKVVVWLKYKQSHCSLPTSSSLSPDFQPPSSPLFFFSFPPPWGSVPLTTGNSATENRSLPHLMDGHNASRHPGSGAAGHQMHRGVAFLWNAEKDSSVCRKSHGEVPCKPRLWGCSSMFGAVPFPRHRIMWVVLIDSMYFWLPVCSSSLFIVFVNNDLLVNSLMGSQIHPLEMPSSRPKITRVQ